MLGRPAVTPRQQQFHWIRIPLPGCNNHLALQIISFPNVVHTEEDAKYLTRSW